MLDNDVFTIDLTYGVCFWIKQKVFLFIFLLCTPFNIYRKYARAILVQTFARYVHLTKVA